MSPRRTYCAFGLTLYKTFRRHGLQLLAGLIQPGVADAMEGTVDRVEFIHSEGWMRQSQT